MKRVLVFSLAYYPHVGGAEIALTEIAKRLTEIEFHIVTLRFGNEPINEKEGNIVVYRVGGGSWYLSKILFVIYAAREARRLHERLNFETQWAMMSYMLFPLVLARLDVPYVLTLQDGDPFERVYRRWFILPFLPLLWIGFKNANKVTAISNYLAEWARRMGYRGEVAIVPNGADVEHFGGANPASLNRTEDETWLVTSSRLVYKNALDDVIAALALLPHSVHFLILGSGKEEASLKQLARELNVAERVHFKGYVSHRELPGYLHACDIFVRPSRTEGFGSSFVEAMAAGLPVIGTSEGGLVDFLTGGETGWVVEKNSPEQIARAVKEIMTNPVKVERIRENAHRLVRQKYTWEIIAGQMREVFDSTI